MLIITCASTGEVEANNTAIKTSNKPTATGRQWPDPVVRRGLSVVQEETPTPATGTAGHRLKPTRLKRDGAPKL